MMAMATFSPLSPTYETYIKQYLNTASNGNVYLSFYTFGIPGTVTGDNFHRFKCGKCQDNFAVKEKLFWDNAVPQELQNWLKLHRHPKEPCDLFEHKEAINPTLCVCGFQKVVHQFSCVSCGTAVLGATLCSYCAGTPTITNPEGIPMQPGQVFTYDPKYYKHLKGMSIPAHPMTMQPTPQDMQIDRANRTLPEHRGRKFRT